MDFLCNFELLSGVTSGVGITIGEIGRIVGVRGGGKTGSGIKVVRIAKILNSF